MKSIGLDVSNEELSDCELLDKTPEEEAEIYVKRW